MMVDDFNGFSPHKGGGRSTCASIWFDGGCILLREATGVERARERLGEKVWNAAIFDTRHIDRVSLADMAFWIGEGRVVAAAFGGGRIKEDYALDASPKTMALLVRIFGSEAVQRVGLEQTLVAERMEQRQLPGVAQRGFVVPRQPAQSEEEGEDLPPQPVEPQALPVRPPIELPVHSPMETAFRASTAHRGATCRRAAPARTRASAASRC